jgi:methylthioribose-1-phosphate isomerase
VGSTPARPIWWHEDGSTVLVIDQRELPHRLVTREWRTWRDAARGVAVMEVRGAPLIGVAAAHGLALASLDDPSDDALRRAAAALGHTRPTAVNLAWALDRVLAEVLLTPVERRAAVARELASLIADEDATSCRAIGEHGVQLLRDIHERTGRAVQVLTHCNAGWLACVEWGTATAPVYVAIEAGVPVHVWVSETRPRNQGASLTAWELGRAGVPHTLVVDNAAGHLIARGEVDVVLVGADRIAANGDAVNKIGTVLKALAAHRHGVPFLVAAPWSTFEAACPTGDDVPIEERAPEEVLRLARETIAPAGTNARNWGFDVTPADLVTGYVMPTGIHAAGELVLWAARAYNRSISVPVPSPPPQHIDTRP